MGSKLISWTRLFFVVVSFALVVAGCEREQVTTENTTPSSAVQSDNQFEDEIRAFEAADLQKPPSENAILFVGSSSIRLWTSLAEDMAPIPVIRRGFGGASLGDCIHYVDRVVTNYEPEAIFVFCGTNDIAGETPKSAEEVVALYMAFVGRVWDTLPDTPIYFISISPTKSRWQHVSIVRKANQLVEQYTKTSDHLHYIDTASALLNASGEPRDELFREDQLHLTEEGYAVWTAIIRPIVEGAYVVESGAN